MIDKFLEGLRPVLQTMALVALVVTVFSLTESVVYASGCSSGGYSNSSCATPCTGTCTYVSGGGGGGGPTCKGSWNNGDRCLCT